MVRRLNEPSEVEAALRAARFDPIEVWTDKGQFRFESVAEWWEDFLSGATGSNLARLDAETRTRFEAEAFQIFRDLKDADGFADRGQAIFGRGIKLN